MIRVYSAQGAPGGSWSVTGAHLAYLTTGRTLYARWRGRIWSVALDRASGQAVAVPALDGTYAETDELYIALADILERCALQAEETT